jgi:hypothetical protein
MSSTRYAVVAYQRNARYRFGEFLGFGSEGATVITSTPTGVEKIESFGGTIGEIYFRECDSQEDADYIADKYNRLIHLGIRGVSLSKIPPRIWNNNCQFFSDSAYIKCAVNPCGTCTNCLDYEGV